MIMRKIVFLMLLTIFSREISGISVMSKKSKEVSNDYKEFIFAIEVKKFCQDKPKTNFCSKRMIDMMLKIETERLQKLELERLLKRMKSKIIKKAFNVSI